MASVEAYTISVPETHIDRLAQKLSLSTFPDELQGAEWTYGAPLADIERLTAYWKEGFDWRKQEVKLNQMPNFRTSIHIDGFESIDLHFIHQKSQVEGAIPLLFCHGWPGSFLEVSKLLPLLSSGDNHSPAFHIVAPSIPNYGFSSAINKKGFGLAQYAETCNQLMQKLGYTKYGIGNSILLAISYLGLK
ncbi:hypothetical protein MMC12_004789 [Toensbergia leucococca]|nr:hypothetical protein [Toensbergia leucococca]